MDIRAAEISTILKDQIENFGADAEVTEVGKVLSVGDGIARIYGLDQIQAGEMVEFPGGIAGMALNLERDNVGVVIFGSDKTIKEGDEILISTNKGRVIRVAVKEIRTAGRNTQGVRIIKLTGEEKVVSADKINDNLV